jgi:hypothetical protein
MKKLLALLPTLVALAAIPAASGSGTLLSGHSHWDDPNANYEIKTCYDVLGNNGSAGSEIMHIPFREQDSNNFYDLQLFKTGFKLSVRVNGNYTTVTPMFSTPMTVGVGSEVMFDFVVQGDTFTLYNLNDDNTRGAELYQWTNSTYSRGVNISYYTVSGWEGRWDNVFATPLDNVGVGHVIHGLLQDAREVPQQVSGEVTFDSTVPANGSVTGVTAAKSGSTQTWGLPSGDTYTYAITVNQAGTGHFDFRDPASANLDDFFTSSYYRLSLGSTPYIQRFNGSAAGTKYSAPAGTGGGGTYRLNLLGGTITLIAPNGATLVAVNDGGPTSGVRVRLAPGNQTWSWVGVVGDPGQMPQVLTYPADVIGDAGATPNDYPGA